MPKLYPAPPRLPWYLISGICTGYDGDGGAAVMLMILVMPPVERLATCIFVVALRNARFSVEFTKLTLPSRAAAVPAVPPRLNTAFVTFTADAPPPLTIVPADSEPPVTLTVPAEPAVSVPDTAAR